MHTKSTLLVPTENAIVDMYKTGLSQYNMFHGWCVTCSDTAGQQCKAGRLVETYVSGESQFFWYMLSGLKQQRKA